MSTLRRFWNRFKAVVWVLCYPLFYFCAAVVVLIEYDWKLLAKELWHTVEYLWNKEPKQD